MGRLRSGKVAVVAASDAYPKGWHSGKYGGLDAVDADLAPGNIKDGVVVFGHLGTYTGEALVEDIVGSGVATSTLLSPGGYLASPSADSGVSLILASKTQAYAAGSLAVGVAALSARVSIGSTFKLNLDMDGTIVAESAYIGSGASENWVAIGTRALAGTVSCSCKVKNYDSVNRFINFYGFDTSSDYPATISVGSVKK